MGKICIGGYAGCGNLGDDAILQGMIEALERNGVPRRDVTALTGRPKRDEKRFGVRCVGRMNPAAILRALRGADVFVSGGGTLLQNRTGDRSLAYYLALLRLARTCGCRTVCLGGAGPLNGRDARRRVADELNRCAAVLMRDTVSLDLLREIGVSGGHGANDPRPLLRAGSDPAFLLPTPPSGRAAFLRKTLTGTTGVPFFCVFAGNRAARTSDPLLSAVARAAHGMTPVFLASDRKKDVFYAHAAQISVGGAAFVPRDVSELSALVSSARFVVSRRLHPLILSVRFSVPCLGIGSLNDDADPKLLAFCRSARVPFLPPDVDADAILSAILSLPSLPPPVPDPFRENAEKDLSILAKIMYNKDDPLGKETLFFP